MPCTDRFQRAASARRTMPEDNRAEPATQMATIRPETKKEKAQVQT